MSSQDQPHAPAPKLIKKWGAQEWLITLVVSVGILGFISFTIYTFLKAVPEKRDAIILDKYTAEYNENRVTVFRPGSGQGPVKADTYYVFKVRMVETGIIKSYSVDAGTYQRYKVGDQWYAPEPAQAEQVRAVEEAERRGTGVPVTQE